MVFLGLFFPFAPVFHDESYETVAKALLKRVLASNKGAKGYLNFKPLDPLLYLQQVVMPMNDHIMRIIFMTTLSHDGDEGCCSTAGALTWLPQNDASSLSNPLLYGVEVIIIDKNQSLFNINFII